MSVSEVQESLGLHQLSRNRKVQQPEFDLCFYTLSPSLPLPLSSGLSSQHVQLKEQVSTKVLTGCQMN